MDFQSLVNSFHAPTCIISVQKTPDGGYGEIRLVAGNAKYLEPIEHPVFPYATDMSNMPDMPDLTKLPELTGIPEVFHTTKKFVPNSLYERYLPKDIGFEDLCFRAAVGKVPIHTYVHLNNLDIWFDIFCLPIDYEDGDLCYIAYTAQPSNPAEVGISSSQSGTSSEDILKICVKLYGTEDFNKTMDEVVKDIRLISRADGCSVLLFNEESGLPSILAASYDESCSLRRVTEFSNFNDITMSWLDMIAGSDCLIIKDDKDRSFIRQINFPWCQNLEEAGVESFILFPLRYNSEVLGFIWATNFDTTNTMHIKETLELTSYFMSSKLSAYKMVEHLRKISYTDQLTGIPNRFAISEQINDLIWLNERFAVISIDINSFKSINDTMGFETGNEVLKEIAARWKTIAEAKLSGTQDTIARIGGDEFALIVRDYRSDDEILQTIRQYESILNSRLTVEGCDFYITASFGYAVYPYDARTRDNLCSYAYASMCEVKRVNSSNHILHFTPDLLKTEQTLEMERKLRNALETDSLYYHLQPQYDLSHKLRGFEALARMKDADGNNIPPGEFIPVAEQVGLVDKVDGAVFRKSAMFIGDIIRKTGADIILSVNVSVRHLMKNDFLDEVRSILIASGLPAERLEIEITESIMIDSADKALQCIDSLHRMGIKIALDDFGTGYSSLSYLNEFPANLIKIDKSFIDRMDINDSSKQYVAAIISIGHIMGFHVISEGVETKEQLEMLREIGCDYVQGYIWGKPLPKEEAAAVIMESLQS